MKKALLGTVLSIAFAGAASAAPISGSFSARGFGVYLNDSGNVTTEVNATRLDFGCGTALAGCTVTGGGNGFGTPGSVLVTLGQGSFSAFVGTAATIQDVQLGGLGTTTANPVGSAFLTFGGGAITLDFANATATHNTQTGQAIDIVGTGTYTSGGTMTPGTFQLLTASAGTAAAVSFQFTVNGTATAIPEPISLSLLGVSLLGLGLIGRRKTG
ncbi:MAG: hypothetical protein RQ966_16335 [Acetobacteraceae bacterium]|nr:hypothetical protein [Acetobacteraceae bacterium]